jgi:hypothetical protein
MPVKDTAASTTDAAQVAERLRAAYDKVALWPEDRMPGVDISTLGTGFTDLLSLRNEVPAAANALEALSRQLAEITARQSSFDRRGDRIVELSDNVIQMKTDRDDALGEVTKLVNELCEEKTLRQDAEHGFKNFHRSLCERFDYTHDEVDWRRDQVSLIEWIAKQLADALAERDYIRSVAGESRVTLVDQLVAAEAELAQLKGTGGATPVVKASGYASKIAAMDFYPSPYEDAERLLSELDTFHSNTAGDRAIAILRRIIELRSALVTSPPGVKPDAKALEKAAALVEIIFCGDGTHPEEDAADDVFNGLYKEPLTKRLEALGRHVASRIRALTPDNSQEQR